MYKMLFFLAKTDEDKVLEHFNDYTLKQISAVEGKEVKAAVVESNLMLDQKFSRFCEITAGSKEEMDEKMSSPEGKRLNKDLMNFHHFITVITVNYQEHFI